MRRLKTSLQKYAHRSETGQTCIVRVHSTYIWCGIFHRFSNYIYYKYFTKNLLTVLKHTGSHKLKRMYYFKDLCRWCSRDGHGRG